MMIGMCRQIQPLILILLLVPIISSQNCSSNSQKFLITFHPHLDAFWLNSDNELKDINFIPAPFLYEMNQRNSKTILNSMLQALASNSTRKYFITEVVFFKDWYQYLHPDHRQKIQRLIANHQFQIVNGGWVQNDEAVCYFDDILDQYTIGLHYLKNKLNYEVKIGWATDSFGHSHSQAALLHLLGFEFQAIERVDDRYIHQRKKNSLLEFYWSPVSDSNNLTYGGITTYVRHFLHEVNNLRATTPESIAQDFTKLDKIMKKLYHKPKMFRFLGNDFEEFITQQFQTLEKAMDLLNSQSPNKQCPVFAYGNPSDYLSLISKQYNPNNLPVRKEDFMPNWDQDHYWTGYYTTDPDLKKICKDYSRLLNLFRKIHFKKNKKEAKTQKLINESNELLALMQHHDGITATSKRHIQKELKERMRNKSQQIISQAVNTDDNQRQICLFYQNGNKCFLKTKQQTVYLTILHEGSIRTQKIELQLESGIRYQISGHQTDYFCFPKINKCFLVFETELFPGKNVIILNRIDSKTGTIKIEKIEGQHFSGQAFKIDLRLNQIDYTFKRDQYFNISLVKARSEVTMTDTVAWNKYGEKENKQERRIPGMYIMTNNGKIETIKQGQFNELHIGVGKIFTKVYAYNQFSSISLTIKKGAEHVLQLQTQFQPPNFQLSDYFLKVESRLNPKDEFYHDMNGYLVMKRKIGFRPDYQWQYKQIDKIAANTYPFCSFGYIKNLQKKLVVFTDRAGGLSLFDKALIINIDRITSDDYKGVGQAYMQIVKNTFHHKIAMVHKEDVFERYWQRTFDEALIGFYSNQPHNKQTHQTQKEKDSYLKYSVYPLSHSQYVLRLVNLHDKKSVTVPKYHNNSWNLVQFGLKMTFQTLKDSFAHGAPIAKRKHWKNIPNQITIFNYNQLDTKKDIFLKPLQIRSFRITLKQQGFGSSSKATTHFQKKNLQKQQVITKIHKNSAKVSKNKGIASSQAKTQNTKQNSPRHFNKRCF